MYFELSKIPNELVCKRVIILEEAIVKFGRVEDKIRDNLVIYPEIWIYNF